MTNYELLIALSEDLSEEAQKSFLKDLNSTIEKNSGEVTSSDSWGKKTLAFPVSSNKNAFYYLLTFKAGPTMPKVISDQFRINDKVLRFLITIKSTSKKPLVKMKKKTEVKEPAFIR